VDSARLEPVKTYRRRFVLLGIGGASSDGWWSMSSAWKLFASTVIRWLLTIVSAWFIRKGIISEGDATLWIPEMTAGILGVLASLGWALWTRIQHRVGFLAALELPAKATPSDVREVVADLTVTEKVTAALEPTK
jgi:hypothetical protein